jgi:probable rRNA maturation factor
MLPPEPDAAPTQPQGTLWPWSDATLPQPPGTLPPEPRATPPRPDATLSLPDESPSTTLHVSVEFAVEHGIDAAWDELRFTALVRSIVDREFADGGRYVISLHLVGNETIRHLNTEHRGVDAHTDVLSFPLQDPNGMRFVLPPSQPANLGDVVVSHPTAVAQARDFGHSLERELGYLVAHGVLHVLGYDHEEVEDRRRMRHREEEALRPLGFTR